jgi:mannonate dehydratase
MMKIGTRISPDWLNRPADLSFLKQIGVDCVDITLDICPGYSEHGGRANRAGLEYVAEILDKVGLRVERANTLNRDYINTFLGIEGSEQELENLSVNAELCGAIGFPVMGIQCFQAAQCPGFPGSRHEWPVGRGGYRHLQVDLSDALDDPPIDGAPSHEQLWERTLSIFRSVMPVAGANDVRIAMHGNDPPVPSIHGSPQILYNFAAFDRLFTEVRSPNNGMTFCVGTRYESGEDIFAGIRHFGKQGKIFHVHFRNVINTIPDSMGYSEVIPDDGDLNMYRVARALHDIGYDGAIDYDHIMKLPTDGEAGREYIAFCVGHMRGILQSIEAVG